MFRAHLSGILPHDQLRMSLSGDLVNSMRDLTALPNSVSLVGVLTQSKGLIEGKFKINVPMYISIYTILYMSIAFTPTALGTPCICKYIIFWQQNVEYTGK